MDQDQQYIPVADVDRRIAEIEQQLERLPIELDVLRRLRTDTVSIPKLAQSDIILARRGRLGPTQAVLQYLAQNRRPHTIQEIIREIEDSVDSSAANVRRSLYSTISNLKTSGMIQEQGDGVTISPQGLAEID